MKTLKLPDSDVSILISALSAVSPSGGGSDQFTLLRRIKRQMDGCEEDVSLTAHYQTVAHNEYVEFHDNDGQKPHVVLRVEAAQSIVRKVYDVLSSEEAMKCLSGSAILREQFADTVNIAEDILKEALIELKRVE